MLGLVITKIKGDRSTYVRDKLSAATHNSTPITDEDIAELVSVMTDDALPISNLVGVAPKAHRTAEIDARQRCALRNLISDSPLLKGEVVEEDFFSFLSEPFEEVPAGTAVLRRTTNMAVLYYIFPDYRVTPEIDLIYSDLPMELVQGIQRTNAPEIDELQRFEVLAANLKIDFREIAKTLGTGLLSFVGGQIAALIFDLIFPPSVPSYFDEVYKEVARIVKQELHQHDIDLIEAKINAVLDWERRIYAPKSPRNVTDQHERENLFREVEDQINSLNEAMSVLTSLWWRESGMSVFAVAGGVYLGLCQEAALMDYKVSNPKLSSYATTIKLTATDYANSLEATFQAVLKKRVDNVFLKQETVNIQIGRKSYMTNAYRWVDPIAGTKGKLHALRKEGKKKLVGDPKKEGEDDMNNYKAQLPEMLAKALGEPLDLAGKWRKLETQPLPPAV